MNNEMDGNDFLNYDWESEIRMWNKEQLEENMQILITSLKIMRKVRRLMMARISELEENNV